MGTLLVILVAASLGLGVLLIGAGHMGLIRRAGRVVALLLGASALLLPFGQGAHWTLGFRWPPGAGSAGLEVAAPSVYIVVGLFVSMAAGLQWDRDRSPPYRLARGLGLAPLICGLVAVGVTIDHFLLRYVVLELVALVSVASLWSALPTYHHAGPLWRVFLPWKLGDDALLLAILILAHAVGTYDIQSALEGALLLDPIRRLVVALSVVLAAWVKLGLPPFHGWLLGAAAAPASASLWQATGGLPVLGAYLLYRFHPLISSLGLWAALAGLGVLAVLGATLAEIRLSGRRPSHAWWPVWHGALALPAVAMGLGRWYLISFIPMRILLAMPSLRRPVVATTSDVSATRLPALLISAVEAARAFDAQVLGRANEAVAALVGRLGAALASSVERSLEAANAQAADLAHSVAGNLQRRHTGRLRSNLLWAMFGLLGVLLAAIISRRV